MTTNYPSAQTDQLIIMQSRKCVGDGCLTTPTIWIVGHGYHCAEHFDFFKAQYPNNYNDGTIKFSIEQLVGAVDSGEREQERLKAKIEELRARVSELEDWHSRCVCHAASRSGRDLCSRKQIDFIEGLAAKASVNAEEMAKETFGAAVAELTTHQASQMIDLLKKR